VEAAPPPPGPGQPRWTHIALPSADLDASIAWYETFTPLVLLDRREDADGQSAWLCHDGQVENPFILVLVMFFKDRGTRQPHLAPFAHIGIEVPERADVIEIADRARTAGCLVWEPQQMPDPIGFICAITDPDGNVIEISHGQGVYAKVQEVWGSSAG
jgi:catechol 2,3-dioxygenase-like lactoylglutathione lyase family enzyme